MTASPGEGEEDTPQHELVIIRRRSSGEDEAHHGGVWKIAHADFMTALMAFFLVMWLITATDEKTIKGVANYFNPMRLTDSSGKPKGVFNMDPDGKQDTGDQGAPEAGKATRSKSAERAKNAEAAMFSDPSQALEKLAAQAGKASPAPAHRSGEAFRDPFDPDLRYELSHQGQAARPGVKDAADGKSSGTDASREQPGTPIDPATEKASTDLRRRIEEAVKQTGFVAMPGIEVRATGEGVLISITDQPGFEMFGIASARPKPELVVLMEKIGKVILGRPEQVIIRGHTDARPFRSDDYDNWRLSTARAHMAYYMLERGGVPDTRFDHVEGYADHKLKVDDQPLASENRRIEVLLVKGKP